ncbi:hypothetical protein HK096_008644, partial [Nowakowskiella sp. JEL0078]
MLAPYKNAQNTSIKTARCSNDLSVLLSQIANLERRDSVSKSLINKLKNDLKLLNSSKIVEKQKNREIDENQNQRSVSNKEYSINYFNNEFTSGFQKKMNFTELQVSNTIVVKTKMMVSCEFRHTILQQTETVNLQNYLDQNRSDFEKELDSSIVNSKLDIDKTLYELQSSQKRLKEQDEEIFKLRETIGQLTERQNSEINSNANIQQQKFTLERLLSTTIAELGRRETEISNIRSELTGQKCLMQQTHLSLIEKENQNQAVVQELSLKNQQLASAESHIYHLQMELKRLSDTIEDLNNNQLSNCTQIQTQKKTITNLGSFLKKRGLNTLFAKFFITEITLDVHKLVNSSHWAPDISSARCQIEGCDLQFGILVWRHHCRICGKLVCNNHLTNDIKISLTDLTFDENGFPTKVCTYCQEEH